MKALFGSPKMGFRGDPQCMLCGSGMTPADQRSVEHQAAYTVNIEGSHISV